MSTIASQYDDVKFQIGNRDDLINRVPRWIAKAYVELGSNIPFPTLEEGPDVIVTAAGSDSYEYPSEALGITACTGTFNGAQRPISKKNMQYIDLYPTTAQGPPVIWAPFKTSQVFRPVPDRSYVITRRFWKRPIVDMTSTSTINATELLIPDNWMEILTYTAAMRGFIDLEDRQKGQELRILLYGDPKHPADNPGLIKERLTRIQAESMNSDYGMRMKVRPYTSAR